MMYVNMTQQYPLYDQLATRVDRNPAEPIDVTKLDTTINSLAQMLPNDYKEHYAEIQALILHHEVISHGTILTPLPYGQRPIAGTRGIIVTTSKLPERLQRILAAYIAHYTAA
jgi:hypothetical protein